MARTPWNSQKIIKDTVRGGEKSGVKTEEVSKKGIENIVTEDILRWENGICILFKYSAILQRHYSSS